jgi:hypothetical protein
MRARARLNTEIVGATHGPTDRVSQSCFLVTLSLVALLSHFSSWLFLEDTRFLRNRLRLRKYRTHQKDCRNFACPRRVQWQATFLDSLRELLAELYTQPDLQMILMVGIHKVPCRMTRYLTCQPTTVKQASRSSYPLRTTLDSQSTTRRHRPLRGRRQA